MSSEPAAMRGYGERHRVRLHSLLWRWQARVFASLLVVDAGRACYQWVVGTSAVRPEGLLHASAFGLLAFWLWFRTRGIFATDSGIEITSGKRVRVIPWDQFVELRQAPMTWLDPPWYPLRVEVSLAGGEVLEFVGRRDAREIAGAARLRR